MAMADLSSASVTHHQSSFNAQLGMMHAQSLNFTSKQISEKFGEMNAIIPRRVPAEKRLYAESALIEDQCTVNRQTYLTLTGSQKFNYDYFKKNTVTEKPPCGQLGHAWLATGSQCFTEGERLRVKTGIRCHRHVRSR